MRAHDYDEVCQQGHRRAGVLERHLGQARHEHGHGGLNALQVIGHDAVFLQRLHEVAGDEPDGGAVFDHAGDGQRVEELLPVVLHFFGEGLGHAGGVLIGCAEDIRQHGDEEVLHILRVVFARGGEARRDRLAEVNVEVFLRHVDLEDLAEIAARDVLRVDAPGLEVVGPVDAAVVRDLHEFLEHGGLVAEIVVVALGRHDAVDAVAGEVPVVERDVGHEVVFVHEILDVVIQAALHLIFRRAHGRLIAIAVQVVRAEADALAEAVAVVERSADHVGHGRAAAVARDPDLQPAGDAGVSNVGAQVVEHLVAAEGEALVLARGVEPGVAAPLGVVVVAAHADGDERIAAAVVANGLAGAVDADGVGLGGLEHPFVRLDVFKAALLGHGHKVAVAGGVVVRFFGVLARVGREREAHGHQREILAVRVAALGKQIVAVGKVRLVVMGVDPVTGSVAYRDGPGVPRVRRGGGRHERHDQHQAQQQADDALFHVLSPPICRWSASSDTTNLIIRIKNVNSKQQLPDNCSGPAKKCPAAPMGAAGQKMCGVYCRNMV